MTTTTIFLYRCDMYIIICLYRINKWKINRIEF
nr:MAG TPA: hypothetical protein [Caudoviricetes sp.]